VAYRIMKVEDHHELSGAAYPFSQFAGGKLTDALRQSGTDGRRILFEWVQQFLTPPPLPELRNAHTGEPIRLITDHYKVLNWEGFAAALSDVPEIEGDSQHGWTWLAACEDGQMRSRAAISRGKAPDKIEVFYQTQRKADEGRSRLGHLFGASASYLTREINEPLPQGKPRKRSPASVIPPGIDPETVAAAIEQAIRRAYANWADEPIPALGNKTPRETIKTPSGLERVKGLSAVTKMARNARHASKAAPRCRFSSYGMLSE